MRWERQPGLSPLLRRALHDVTLAARLPAHCGILLGGLKSALGDFQDIITWSLISSLYEMMVIIRDFAFKDSRSTLPKTIVQMQTKTDGQNFISR